MFPSLIRYQLIIIVLTKFLLESVVVVHVFFLGQWKLHWLKESLIIDWRGRSLVIGVKLLEPIGGDQEDWNILNCKISFTISLP